MSILYLYVFFRFTLDIAADYKTARGFSSRQYSDFFSLLFGGEDKENSTASWDYETETESTNTEYNTNSTNEKGLLDAIKDSLSYVDENKQNADKQTNVTNQTDLFVPNIPTYNVSDGDDNNDNDDDTDDDDEEISLLDFFLKGESAFAPSTTLKPFVFNITSKPLLNGMTNSPMQIQPVLPDSMKNESLKFSMLPMSLYNMVKEDGSLMFDDGKTQQVSQKKPSNPPSVSSSSSPSHLYSQSSIKEHHTRESLPIPPSTIKMIEPTTTMYRPTQTTTTTPKKVIETSSVASTKVKTKNNSKVHASNQTANVSSTATVIIKNVSTKQSVSSTQKIVESSTITIKNISRTSATPKPINSSLAPNVTAAHVTTTTAQTTFATTKSPTKKVTNTIPKIVTTTVRTTTKATTTSTPKKVTTISLKPLTTQATPTTTALPRITAVQINSNPSILEADINYDYSEPTLPPSLPNLRIIPFLPTDAVKKGEAQKNDGFKSNNYNYYHLSSNPYSNSETHASSSSSASASASAAYSPFNIKPPIEKHPVYTGNIADDRIDYGDSYKPTGTLESLDYISVYTGAGNLIQPQSFQMSVNSKLDYEPNHDHHKVIPSKIPIVPSKNLTVKPPLPPFEPEHEYDLYNNNNRPSQPTLHPGGVSGGGGSGYHEYSVNAPNANEPYASEHNYNVPQFVTIPPIKEPPRRPIHNKESVFSYGSKNKFIPPIKTEGNWSFYSLYDN